MKPDNVATVSSPDGGLTVIITGPNNGSGDPNEIDWTIVPSFNGTASFDWAFSSLDDPGLDGAGFIVNGMITPLADTDGEHGSNTVNFFQGQKFGFFASSVDSQGEPGIFTLTNFIVSSGPVTGPDTTAPEPKTLALCLVLMLILFLARNMRAARAKSSPRRPA